MTRPPPIPRPAGPEHPFSGWAWRAAEPADLARRVYLPGRVVKHPGPARLALDPPAAPGAYLVRVHLGWRRGRALALPEGTCFEVRALVPACRPLVVLEQLGPDWGADPRFGEGLARALARHDRTPAGNLAPPGPSDPPAPFACWRPGDPPGAPPWEPEPGFEDAVGYIAAWAGLEPGAVWERLAPLWLGQGEAPAPLAEGLRAFRACLARRTGFFPQDGQALSLPGGDDVRAGARPLHREGPPRGDLMD